MRTVAYEIIISLALLFVVGGAVFADLYQYTDENGVMVFTDDVSRLSEAQRANSKTLSEIKSEPADVPQTRAPGTSSEDGVQEISDVLMQETNALIQENKKLNQDYAMIVEENKKLADLRERLRLKKNISRSELDNFNKQVEEMNIKTKEYDSRLKSHQNRTKAYNLKLERVKRAAKTENGD